MDRLPLPQQLRAVPQSVLEEYVSGRIKQFSRLFAVHLLGHDLPEPPIERAFNLTTSVLNQYQQQGQPLTESFILRFTHKCRFFACTNKECSLCIQNPNKRCGVNDNFDESYADNQLLKSKCDADVYVELVSRTTGIVSSATGVEIQVYVVDGESCSNEDLGGFCMDKVKELLKSDDGEPLLGGSTASNLRDASGRVTLTLQAGSCRLPDLVVTDKTDTFRMDGHPCMSFRLMARAVQRDQAGSAVVLQHVEPALSTKFCVKTQRAMNDFCKPDYPHYKEKVTKLKFIGGVGAERLREIHLHIPDIPFTSIVTVEQLKQLMMYTEKNRLLEGKLLDILHMMGKHKHKWDYLSSVLLDKVVYDDALHRAWYADEAMTQGLLFSCKQGQVNMEKPFGIVQRVVMNGQVRLQALQPTDPHNLERMRMWRAQAEEAWDLPGHRGWTVLAEPLELAGGFDMSGSCFAQTPSMGRLDSMPLRSYLSGGSGERYSVEKQHSGSRRPSILSVGSQGLVAPTGRDSPARSGSAGSPGNPTYESPAAVTAAMAGMQNLRGSAPFNYASWAVGTDSETPGSVASRSSSNPGMNFSPSKRAGGVLDSVDWGSRPPDLRNATCSAPGMDVDLHSKSLDLRSQAAAVQSRARRKSSDCGELMSSSQYLAGSQAQFGYSEAHLAKMGSATKRRRPSLPAACEQSILQQLYGSVPGPVSPELEQQEVKEQQPEQQSWMQPEAQASTLVDRSSAPAQRSDVRRLSAAMLQNLHLSDDGLPLITGPPSSMRFAHQDAQAQQQQQAPMMMAYSQDCQAAGPSTVYDAGRQAQDMCSIGQDSNAYVFPKTEPADAPDSGSMLVYPFSKPDPLRNKQLSGFLDRSWSDSFGRMLDSILPGSDDGQDLGLL